MDVKKCSRCGKVKPVEEFHYQKKAEGKRCAMCRDCKNEKSRANYWAHPETSRKACRLYRLNNLDEIKERDRERYLANIDEERAKARARYWRAKEAEAKMPPEEREKVRAKRAAAQHRQYLKRKARILRGEKNCICTN